jgi:hypothetical protein
MIQLQYNGHEEEEEDGRVHVQQEGYDKVAY